MHTPPTLCSCPACPPRRPQPWPVPRRRGRALPGVNGAVSATAPFADAWAARTGQASMVLTACACTCSASSSDRPAYRVAQVRPPDQPISPLLRSGLAPSTTRPNLTHRSRTGTPRRATVTEAESTCGRTGAPVAVAAVSAPLPGGEGRTGLHTPGQRRRATACRDAEATAAALPRGRARRALHRPRQPDVQLHLPSNRLPARHDAEERPFSDQRRRRSGRTICGPGTPGQRATLANERSIRATQEMAASGRPASKGEVASQRPWAVRWPGEASLSVEPPRCGQPSRRP